MTCIDEIVEFILSVEDVDIERNKEGVVSSPIDIYIASKKLAIDFDDIETHSEQHIPNRRHHLNKTNECELKDINMLHIFGNEWMNKKDIWKSMIINKLAASHRVYARKCEVRKLTNAQSAAFFDKYHLQGRGYGENCSLALVADGVAVSAMSFAVPRYNNTTTWELLRMSNRLGHLVVGGFSKLLKEFKKTHSGSLVSYANRRFSTGNVYETLGFSFQNNSAVSYFYHKLGENELLHRSSFMKHKLASKFSNFDPSKTEYDNMVANGYDRIWDCGAKVYILEK